MRYVEYPEGRARIVPASKLPFSYVRKAAQWSFGLSQQQGSLPYDNLEEFRLHIDWYRECLHEAVTKDGGSYTESLLGMESTFAKRAEVAWRDLPLGLLQPEYSYVVTNSDQAEILRPGVIRLRKIYSGLLARYTTAQLRDLYLGAEVPLSRGKGWPFFLGGDPAQTRAIMALIARAETLDDVHDALSRLGPLALPPCMVGIRRDEGSTKPQKKRAIINDELVVIGERHGPKVRKVSMCPFVYNIWLFGVQHLWSELEKLIPANSPDMGLCVTETNDWLKSGFQVFSGDLSTYDDTVSIESRQMVFDEFIEPLFGAAFHRRLGLPAHYWRLCAEVYHAFGRLPILLPPRRRDQGALLWDSLGRFQSGENFTARLGTLLNHARNYVRCRELDIPPRFRNKGDDQLNAAPPGFDVAQWPDARTGFKESVSHQRVFLMRDADSGHGLLARMLSLQKEVRNEPPNVVVAALGFASRLDILNAVGVNSPHAKAHPSAHRYISFLHRHPKARVRQAAQLCSAPRSVLMQLAIARASLHRADEDEAIFSALEGGVDAWENRPGEYATFGEFIGLAKSSGISGGALGELRKNVYTRRRR